MILTVSGSLRKVSSNTVLLQAAGLIAPELELASYGGLADLPAFNPDLDDEGAPQPVLDWRAQLRAARGVLFCSPEYAHGLPGVLKNALDWVVGSGELVDKPVAILSGSPRATFVQAQLSETLRVMNARLVREAFLTLALGGSRLDAAGLAATAAFAIPLRDALAAFARATALAEAAAEGLEAPAGRPPVCPSP
jgi:NAD(P)H-dependent FMN reductase